ncbi:MAG: sugar kinase [Planctomycetes bacterium]|nr:sugar kinase [Planctomycetota bacterium]
MGNRAGGHYRAVMLGGIDIGGTKVSVCRGDASGRVHAAERFATPEADPALVLDECVARLAHFGACNAIGVACPGPFLAAEGAFLDPPNMPRWHGFELVEQLRARVSVPVAAMNDANALALAEWQWGAGIGVDTMVFFTMSTGMGAGLVIDGKLWQGRRGFAGEVGHWRLADDGPLGFGKRGSVEGFLSGPGIVQAAEAEARICLHNGESTRLIDESLTAEIVCEAATSGDVAARRVTDACGRRLGQLMALLADLLEPELFVLGTIGTAHPDLFIPPALSVIEREALAHVREDLRVVPSALEARGDQSALAVAVRAISRSS